ncbi:MAG: hypothetical protein GF364_09465 [Candidatus Lokiarchaeota archaeon]|nr:hypothetical protein [Candidatus Lokiarchaeota archaeon]
MEPKNKKLFVFITIPLLIFVSMVVGFYYLMLTGWSILIIGALCIGTFGRDNGVKRLTRALTIITIFLFVFYPNIPKWSSQFARRLPGGRNSLIEPDHPNFPELNDTFREWHLDRYGYAFDLLDDLETEVKRVDYFIRWNVTEYEYDMFSPYLMVDHLPTVSEIFASDFDGDGRLEDDCDGQTILTASFLLFLGYEQVFISEIDFHWHTIVFPSHVDPLTPEGYDDAIFLYYWGSFASFYIFNQTDTFIPPGRSLGQSLWDIIKSDYIFDKVGYIVLYDGYIPFEVHWSLWIVIILAVGLILSLLFSGLLTMFHKHWVQNWKQIVKTFILATITLAGCLGLLVLFYHLEYNVEYFKNLDTFEFDWIGNIVLFIGIGLNMRVLDHGIIYKGRKIILDQQHIKIGKNNKEHVIP